MKKIITIFIILLITIGVYIALPNKETAVAPVSVVQGQNPTFTWNYFPVTDKDFPQTRITLTATYDNGTTSTKEVDIVDGSCNEYAEPDTDIYDRSTMIICYGAGLGHYFKVIQDGTSYVVMRKTFEEASPEYNPEVQAFKSIVQF